MPSANPAKVTDLLITRMYKRHRYSISFPQVLRQRMHLIKHQGEVRSVVQEGLEMLDCVFLWDVEHEFLLDLRGVNELFESERLDSYLEYRLVRL